MRDGVLGRQGRQFKVMILGSSAVGKSSILNSIFSYDFNPLYFETLGIEIVQREEFIGDVEDLLSFHFWDTGGAGRYLPVLQQNLSGTNVALLVYDVNNLDTVENCVFMRNELLRSCPDAAIYLVAAKCDHLESVKENVENGEKQALSWGVPHFSVSAKTGLGIKELYSKINTN